MSVIGVIALLVSSWRQVPTQRATVDDSATAFRHSSSRVLLQRARTMRLTQDSALRSYEATAYQRTSVFMSLAGGPRRPMFLRESAYHVKWSRDAGAWVDVVGARNAMPMAPSADADDELEESLSTAMMSPIPYFAGAEPGWMGGGSGSARTQVNDQGVVQPLANGAEAYYTYETGDSLRIALPDGRTIQLRALIVRPRSPKWNLALGTFWFEATSGQLVRAVYRLARPLDLLRDARGVDSAEMSATGRRILQAFVSPMQMQVSAVGVEYGLVEGRFWLPSIRSFQGEARVSAMRLPIRIDQRFRYVAVNSGEGLPQIEAPPGTGERQGDPPTREQLQQRRDSIEADSRRRSTARDSVSRGFEAQLPSVCGVRYGGISDCSSVSTGRCTIARRDENPL